MVGKLIQFAGWGVLAGSVLAGCTPDVPPVNDLTTQHVTENARTINAGLMTAIVGQGELKIYLNALGSRLSDAARANNNGNPVFVSPPQVDLLGNDAPLVFTVGGEHVYISTGAVRGCTRETDLAAILAHVYAHIVDRHQQKHDQLDSSDLVLVADLLSRSPMTDSEEQAADQDGYLLFARSGWDPAKYEDAWTRVSGIQAAARASTLSRAIRDLPRPSEEWRRPVVADDSSFRRLLRQIGQISAQPDDMAKLLMRCMKSCVGTDNAADRNAAILSLEALIPAPTGGGGRTTIGPRNLRK